MMGYFMWASSTLFSFVRAAIRSDGRQPRQKGDPDVLLGALLVTVEAVAAAAAQPLLEFL